MKVTLPPRQQAVSTNRIPHALASHSGSAGWHQGWHRAHVFDETRVHVARDGVIGTNCPQ